jgi:sec-independent protein translocase protein TatA
MLPSITASLAFLGPIGWQELLVLAIFGVLIFGKRLPEVGRSIGRGIVEFKKGLAGVEDEPPATDKPSPRIESRAEPTVNTKSEATPESSNPSS